MPDALVAALAGAELTAVYDALSFTRRKEIAVSVAEATQEATRERRIAKALDELRGWPRTTPFRANHPLSHRSQGGGSRGKGWLDEMLGGRRADPGP